VVRRPKQTACHEILCNYPKVEGEEESTSFGIDPGIVI